MSKKGHLWRFAKIAQKVQRQKYVTKSQLIQYLKLEAENEKFLDDQLVIRISERTFENDLRDMRELLGIGIEYCPSNRGYYITDSCEMATMRIVELFELHRPLKIERDSENILFFEKEYPSGMEHLKKLIHAIRKRLCIRFVYTKYNIEYTRQHSGNPYALKVYERRWYLLMQDDKDNHIKTFGLDRMSELEITTKTFIPNSQIDVKKKFDHSFGITIPNNDEQPQEVILAFTPKAADYVKSLPLHHSQKIVSDTKDELRISLNVYLTIELESRILWFGEGVKVIQPQKLIDAVKDRLKKTLEGY